MRVFAASLTKKTTHSPVSSTNPSRTAPGLGGAHSMNGTATLPEKASPFRMASGVFARMMASPASTAAI
eukprot:6589296-Prymnesium_polylepis.1